jgi:hypothetical protein
MACEPRYKTGQVTQGAGDGRSSEAGRGGSLEWVPLGLGVAVLAISSAAPVTRLAAPLGPEVIACLRVSVSALVLAILTHRASARALRVLAGSRRDALWTILAGLCLAAHFGAWIASLSLTTVVRSVALVTCAGGSCAAAAVCRHRRGDRGDVDHDRDGWAEPGAGLAR